MAAKPGYDVSDFVADGGELQRLMESGRPVSAPLADDADVRPAQGLSWTTAAAMAERVGEIEWLWDQWLPLGYVGILAAMVGAGKSAIALDLANRHIRGLGWPDGAPCTVRAPVVLVLDCEGCQGIWASRVKAWDVPGECVLFPGDGFQRVALDDPSVVAGVAQSVRDFGARLVIIDSLRAGLPSSVDENDSRVGSILASWSDLARDTGCAVLMVHHYGKARRGDSGAASVERLRGSSAIAAVARVVLAADRPQGTDRAEDATMRLSVVKSNLGIIPPPIGFEVTGEGVRWCEAPRAGGKPTASDRAVEFIRQRLQDGPVSADIIREEGKACGLHINALYEAKRRLAAASIDDPDDPTRKRKLWSLMDGSGSPTCGDASE